MGHLVAKCDVENVKEAPGPDLSSLESGHTSLTPSACGF